MDCPACKYPDMKVIRSNYSENDSVNRRRQCLRCGKRVNTEEKLKPKKEKEHHYVLIT